MGKFLPWCSISVNFDTTSSRPARRGTMLLFAQCVYLMFSGIYVAKEAIEHILLAAGNGAHGHGHGGPRVNEGASTFLGEALH